MAGDEFELDIGTETSKGAAPPLVLKTSSSNSEEPGGFSSSHGSSQEEGVNLDVTANDVSMTEQHNSTSENLNNSSQEKTPAGRKLNFLLLFRRWITRPQPTWFSPLGCPRQSKSFSASARGTLSQQEPLLRLLRHTLTDCRTRTVPTWRDTG